MYKIVGALWAREKDGVNYFSGVLNDLHGEINIAVFPNNKKQADKQPDMNIVISFDKPQKEDPKEVLLEIAKEEKKSRGRGKDKPPF